MAKKTKHTMAFNPQPKQGIKKKEPKPLKRTALKKKKREPTGELAIFLEIWEERPDICEWCKEPMPMDFSVANYHHVKPKSRFPELRLEKSNIVKICFDCHYREHNHGKNI